jgi:hypothetical protein
MEGVGRDIVKEKLMRKVEDKTILDSFAEDFARVVEKYCKYIIVSGFVAISHGRARGTDDIDMIIERISKQDFAGLHKDLFDSGFKCLQSDSAEVIFDRYLNSGISVRYTRKGEFLPEMELKFAKDELDIYQIETRKKFPLTGTELYFSSIESNIAFKEELLKSDKDIDDAKHLRLAYKDEIDEEEIENIKKKIKQMRG